MPQFLAALNEQIDTTRNLVAFSLIMARVMAIVTLVPFLGARNAPPEVKMGIGVTISMILWPTVIAGATGDVPISAGFFILMMLKEIFVGLAIGFLCAEIFYTVEIAGQLIDILRGANQIQIQVPEIAERSSAFGTLNFQLLLALFLAFDLHHLFLESLFESFVAIPINAFPGYRAGYWPFVDAMLRASGDVIIVSFVLAMPVAIVCLIAETSFGLINRVAPQINAYFMAMPAKVISGCIIFFLAIDLLLEEMLIHARDYLSRVDLIIELMQY